MNLVILLIVAIVCLVAGCILGFVLGSKSKTSSGVSQKDFDLIKDQLASSQVDLAAVNATNQQLSERYSELRADYIKYQQARELEIQNQRIKQDQEKAEESVVLQKLAPVDDVLKKVQTKIEDLENQRKEQYGSLEKSMQINQQQQEQLSKVTNNLTSALKSNQSRGQWGEAQLRTIVEATGMVEHVDFDTQVAWIKNNGTTNTGTANSGTVSVAQRPDMIIHLPGNRSIIVDSKAPADKYFEAVAIDDFENQEKLAERDSLFKEYAKAMRRQVDLLSKKEYWAGDVETPDFVIMFIPSESMLSSALENDPSLLEHAFKQRVALASPVSLFSVIKTVSFVWQQQALNENAQELGVLAQELLHRVSVLAGHSENLRKAIDKSVKSYNRFASSLESQVITQANKIAEKMEQEQIESPQEIIGQTKDFKKAELKVGVNIENKEIEVDKKYDEESENL
ncbi:MAG: DNA recombination protein RmuC [Candidatus Ancillula sp.]|jgi:DNA recombination protein RmuC|nr:DNA recombination protein RmuC [Candidatus Ancillula sp.]